MMSLFFISFLSIFARLNLVSNYTSDLICNYIGFLSDLNIHNMSDITTEECQFQMRNDGLLELHQ